MHAGHLTVVGEHRTRAGRGRERGLKAVERAQGARRHRHRDRHGNAAEARRHAAAADAAGRREHAVFDRADIALHGPGKALVVAEHRQMAVHRRGGELRLFARAQRDGGHGLAVLLDADAVGLRDDIDLRLRARAARVRRHRHGAGGGRGQDIAVNGALIRAQGDIGICHGDIVRVERRRGELHLRVREHAGALALKIHMAHGVCRAAVRHKEDVVRHRALAAAGGLVDKRRYRAVGARRDHRGRAAAIQAQRRHAAELDHALGDLRQRRADGIAALAAIDRVEHERAVALEAHRRARGRAVDKARTDLTVIDQLIERADHIRHAVPLAAVRADGKRQALAGLERAQLLHIARRLQVRRKHILSRADGRVLATLDDLLDHERQAAVQAERAADRRADNIHALLARAGRGAGIEGRVIEIDAERALAHVVESRDRQAAAIIRLRRDAERGLAHHRAAVVAEADGVILARDVAQHALGHHAAKRDARRRVVIVAVDARDHAVAARFELFRGGRDRCKLGRVVAAAHDGLDACVGRVDHIILLTEIRIRIAPERAGVEFGALVDLDA